MINIAVCVLEPLSTQDVSVASWNGTGDWCLTMVERVFHKHVVVEWTKFSLANISALQS